MPLSDPEFKDQLAQVIPHLRAFGRSLSGSRDLADDLVQETLLKAWAARKRFQAGTNMRAWTFIILRNLFLSQMRRARFKGEWDEITASKLLAAPASQDRHIELADMQRALLHLPQPQREALILVGAGGFAYEEAAEICGCAVGTIKSRVARGRVALETLMTEGKLPSRREHRPSDRSALQTIMSEVDELSRDRDPGGTKQERQDLSDVRTSGDSSRGGRAGPRTGVSERSLAVHVEGLHARRRRRRHERSAAPPSRSAGASPGIMASRLEFTFSTAILTYIGAASCNRCAS